MIAVSIPSPPESVWHLGPLPIRAYALAIIGGAVLAIWIGERRYRAKGGRPGTIGDIAIWAVPFGIVGGRLYHVITDPQLYFGEGRDPLDALKIWNGGLGIWGAIALGALGAWIACRRYRVAFWPVADALAPGLLVAQGFGRLGNYANQELFGRPTDAPWGLEIAPRFRPEGFEQFATFHPTFLYELIWNLLAAALIVWLDRRYRLTHGRAFALYVMLYTAMRLVTEALRIDTVNHIGPFRLNIWTTIIVFAGGLLLFLWGRRRAQQSPEVLSTAAGEGPSLAGSSADGATAAGSASPETPAGEVTEEGPGASPPER